jgi:hypothetical protein
MYTVPYLKEKWGCFNQTDRFEFQNCTFATPWNSSDLTRWEKPSDALQNEKVEFLLAESRKDK